MPLKKQSAAKRDVPMHPRLTLTQALRGGRSVTQSADQDALRKITLLESELLKLRAQIAMIVTAAPASGPHSLYTAIFSQNLILRFFKQQLICVPSYFFILLGDIKSQNAPGTALTSPTPLPALASMPCCAAPPPPPPPPPLPCPVTQTSSVLEVIRQRRKDEKDSGKGRFKPQDSALSRGSEPKGMPSMLDVLKDLNQVKLRSVER